MEKKMTRKLVFFILLISTLFCHLAFAADSKPSEQSIKELLAVSEVKKLTDDITGQVDSIMEIITQQVTQGEQGEKLSAADQKILDDMKTQMANALKQEMKWESLEAYYIQIYRETFTQDEVNGILAFYKTPAGQATIKKMPVLMQQAMVETQARMFRLMGQFEEMQKEALGKIEVQKSKDKK
jgi:hypothetical protein